MDHSLDLRRNTLSNKCLADYFLTENLKVGKRYSLLSLRPVDSCRYGRPLPGQFVQVAVNGVDGVMLRRPISVNDYDDETGELRLLVAKAGRATDSLCSSEPGKVFNILLPLGNTFKIGKEEILEKKVVLIGGGVGVAPLLYYARWLAVAGAKISTIIAARTAKDLILVDEFKKYGFVEVCTDDGSEGIKGFATDTKTLLEQSADFWTVCGPTPMMRAVAALSNKRGIQCYASLENVMACGLGACLCCVQKTGDGHNRCVCTEGPVFDVRVLGW